MAFPCQTHSIPGLQSPAQIMARKVRWKLWRLLSHSRVRRMPPKRKLLLVVLGHGPIQALGQDAGYGLGDGGD